MKKVHQNMLIGILVSVNSIQILPFTIKKD